MSPLFESVLATYALVFFAEFGDKSQIICLILATRHRPWPVFFGAISGFLLLTGLAALLGAALDNWLPEAPLQFGVALLFAFFGLQMWRHGEDAASDEADEGSSHGVFLTAFLLIALSEMGDKTQILVVGLSSLQPALPVFAGALLALASTSALGIWAGARLLRPEWTHYLHRTGAVLFLIFALLAGWRGYLALN